MNIEIKDMASIAGVLVTFCLGIYNVWRTRKVANVVDSLLLDDRRYELLQTTIDIETLRTRMRTSLINLRYKIRAKMIVLSATSKNEVQKAIDQAEKMIDDLGKDIVSDRAFITSARESTAPTRPDHDLIQNVNALLGNMKARHSEALLQQATIDGLISDAENLLNAAELHTAHA